MRSLLLPPLGPLRLYGPISFDSECRSTSSHGGAGETSHPHFILTCREHMLRRHSLERCLWSICVLDLTSLLLSSPPLLNSPHISSSPTYLIPSLLNNLHYRSLPPSLELHGYGNHGSILSSISPSPEIQTCTLHRQSSLLQTTKHVFQSSLFCQSSLNAPPGVDKLISSRSSPQPVAALGSVSTAERTQRPMTRPSRRS